MHTSCAIVPPRRTLARQKSIPLTRSLAHIATILAVVVAGLATTALGGCEEGQQEETRTFEEAEALYRAGDFDGATERYEAFLEAYPRSPFAHTAKLRLGNIDREVESVMGAGGSNRPVFIRPSGEAAKAIIDEALGDEADDPAGPDDSTTNDADTGGGDPLRPIDPATDPPAADD